MTSTSLNRIALWVFLGLDRREGSASVVIESHDGLTRRVIHVERGEVVGAQSTVQAERLGNMLVNEGVLDSVLLEPVAAEAARNAVLLGEQLVTDKLLSSDELIDAIERQATLRLGSALAMRGLVKESALQMPSHKVPVRMAVSAALLAAFRKAVPLELVEEVLKWPTSELGELVTHPEKKLERLELGPAELRYTQALLQGQSLDELLSSVSRREPLLRLMAALKMLGLTTAPSPS